MDRNYPNDADGDALRRVAGDGSDMSRPMVVDFMVAATTRQAAEAIAGAARAAGYATDIADADEDGARWTVYCTKTMILDYDDVVAAQRELDELSARHGGYSDGWGTFGNAKPPAARNPK